MKKLSKVAKIVISICTVVIVAGASVGGYFIYKSTHKKKLKYDYRLGKLATQKVENAQYAADVDKYYEINSARVTPTSTVQLSNEDNVAQVHPDDFADLVSEYTRIPYLYGGNDFQYDIYKIKEEIKFVVENVPVFKQWVRMPQMRDGEGYSSIPHAESCAYYLEMDEKSSALSITRVNWNSGGFYLDFDNQKSTGDMGVGHPLCTHEVMKINYSLVDGEEVVECYIYRLGLTNAERTNAYGGPHYTDDEKNYHPIEFIYLKNVKDKTMVKYRISATKKYRADQTFDQGGYDFRGLHPYGFRREFTIVDYNGYTNIQTTKIEQLFNSIEYPDADGSVDFDVNSNNIQILLKSIGYNQDVSSLTSKELMDAISKYIVDNFILKVDQKSIMKGQSQAIEERNIRGPFYGKELLIGSARANIRFLKNGGFYFDAHGDIAYRVSIPDMYLKNLNKFDVDKEYSFSLALKSVETGEIYVIATDYHKLVGSEATANWYDFEHSTVRLDEFPTINIHKAGVYQAVCVLTVKEGQEDVVVFDPLANVDLDEYHCLNIKDSVDEENGKTYSYKSSCAGGRLRIIVSEKQ